MIATSHGPAMRRFGFMYLGSTVATEAIVFGYEYQEKGFLLGISDTPEMQIWDITDPAAPTLEDTLTTPWTAGQIENIQAGPVPGEETMFFVQPDHPQQELKYDPGAGTWTLSPITFNAPPAEWAAGNYPAALAFYEGRTWQGGTAKEPEQIWASVSGEFRNYGTPGDTSNDDALDFTISRRGRIRWFGPAQNLMVGTLNGEHVILSQEGVVTVTDNRIQQQSAYGSFETMAQLIGNIVLYVSPDGRKLRDVGYRWEENNWLSRDITFISEHITENNTLKKVTWAQNPDNLIWGVTAQGNALGCTYERHYNVIGWHRHETQGEYKSLQSIDIGGTSRLMGAFKRTDGLIYYEVADIPRTEHHGVYLDSHVELTSPGDTVSVPHLADQTVSVTVDGATHPDITLNGSGDGTLQFTGTDVHVGLNFNSELETLPLDYTPEEQGTSQHFMKRWNKVFVRLLNSGKPLINGLRPADRTPSTPMGTPEPIRTEDIQVSTLGWDRYSQLVVSQNLPLPLTIAGVFGEVGQKQL
jgi:hypothetical protein